MAEDINDEIKELIKVLKESDNPRATAMGRLGGLSRRQQQEKIKLGKKEIDTQKLKARGDEKEIKRLDRVNVALEGVGAELERAGQSVKGFGQTVGKVTDTLWDLADAGKEGKDKFSTFTGMFSELPAFGTLIDKFGDSLVWFINCLFGMCLIVLFI